MQKNKNKKNRIFLRICLLLIIFFLTAIESPLKIQNKAECFEELALLTFNISLLGYSI